MEIKATPSGRGRGHTTVRMLLGLLLLVLVGLLAPAALGLQAHLVADGAMGDAVPRGAVVYGEVVPPEDLEHGDLLIVRTPADDGTWVTRRLVSVHDDGLVTRADTASAVDPWRVPLDSEPARVSFYVPWLGFPGLVGGPLVWAMVLLALVAAATVVHRLRRGSKHRSGGASERPAAHLRTVAPAL
jgi:hypothetical protein